MKDPRLSDTVKQQKTAAMRKSEVNFLRFLRTSERPQNYATLKIIGKGAFGEVKLVQRKHDGKIYALKSLVKAEMVRHAYFVTEDERSLSNLAVQKGSACPRACGARYPGQRR